MTGITWLGWLILAIGIVSWGLWAFVKWADRIEKRRRAHGLPPIE